MLPHHQTTIERLTAHYAADPAYDALIITGSVVKGLARPDSDVDFTLVATSAEYARRAAQHDYHVYSTAFSDYDGGYVDGKIIDIAFLHEVADRGGEPARAAFESAVIAFSRVDGLDALLARIAAYPEAQHVHKLQSFYAQLQAMQWYVGEAERLGNRYLLLHSASQVVLFGGRMILAHNRVLFPYHKWFMTALAQAADRPPQLMTLIDDLLAAPSKARADALCDAIFSFTDWPQPPEGWPARFMHEAEWAWRKGCAPIGEQ